MLAPSLADRSTTALISAVAMAIMAIGFPVGLLILSRGKAMQVAGIYLAFSGWGYAVIAAAAITGFALGSKRMTVVFGHLWLTERPSNPLVSALLWVGLVLVGTIGYFVLSHHHVS